MSALSPTSIRTHNESSVDLSSWTRDGPVLRLEDAVVETVVTHTTRTTTSFAPISLPRIPQPEHIPIPCHLPSEVYPLANEPIPDDLKFFTLELGGRRVVVQEEGTVLPESGIPGHNGPGWVRSSRPVRRDEERLDVLQALQAKGKEVRKRPHDRSQKPATTPPASTEGMVRRHSPPRKKIRPLGDLSITDGGIMSPLPSPEHDAPSTSANVGSGVEVAALFSLPSIVTHFDTLPDSLQQHVLLHLLRRSRVSTIQRVLSLSANALRRDFISLLPHEIAVQILGYLDPQALAAASCVNHKWYKMINNERAVWKSRLLTDDLFYGLGTEEQEEDLINRRYRALESIDNPTALKHVYRRRYVNNRNWLRAQPSHVCFSGHGTNVVTCLQFDEDKIVSASDDHSINIYNTRTGQLRKRLDGHEGGVWALEYKGDTLVTGSTDRTVRVWDLEALCQVHIFTGHTSTVRCLQIVEPVFDAKTGEYQPPYPMIVTGSRDTTLRVWKLPKKGEAPYQHRTSDNDDDLDPAPPEHNPYHVHHLQGHTQAVRALAAHGRVCISGSYDNTVRVWDIVNGTCTHVLTGHENKVYSIVYDTLRNRCVSGSMDNTVKIWDLATGNCIYTLTGHTSLVGLLGMSPNHIVSAAADASLRVWDANTHELQHVLSSHAGAITCFQHDETKVISGSDGSLKLWDIRTGEVVCDLVIGINSVWQVAFRDNLLVAASNRNNTTVFDVFNFGALNDPSGVDDDTLDNQIRPPWERGNPMEPQTYQLEEYDDLIDEDSSSSGDRWAAPSRSITTLRSSNRLSAADAIDPPPRSHPRRSGVLHQDPDSPTPAGPSNAGESFAPIFDIDEDMADIEVEDDDWEGSKRS